MKKRVLSLVLAFMLLVPQVAFAESPLHFGPRTKGYMILDYDTDSFISGNNMDEEVYIASITKLMTYIIVKEKISTGELKVSDVVKITKDMAQVPGSSMHLQEGMEVTVNDLLEGLIVVSGNDAAYTLAVKVSGDEKSFTNLMNEKAKEIGLEKANFINSTGLPEGDTENSMTVRDVYKMSKYVLDTYPEIIELSSMTRYVNTKYKIDKPTTIPLVGIEPGVDGLKTGTTDLAKYCVISTFRPLKNETLKNERFLAVIMGAGSPQDRQKIVGEIVDYISRNYVNGPIIDNEKVYQKIYVNSIDKGYIDIYPETDQKAVYDKNNNFIVGQKYQITESGPFKAGDKVGVLNITGNNGKVYDVDLVVRQDYNKASFSVRLKRLGRDIRLRTKSLLNIY